MKLNFNNQSKNYLDTPVVNFESNWQSYDSLKLNNKIQNVEVLSSSC